MKPKEFITEMDFDEFVEWAVEQVIEQFLDSGLRGIRSAVRMVVNQASQNEVFGGGKKR